MQKSTTLRIIADLALIFSVLNGWWIAAIFLGIICVWAYGNFIEIIIAGVIFDSLFGYTKSLGWAGYIGTIVSVFIFVFISWFRNVLRR